MSKREIPESGYNNETRNKILNTATELFALKGFNSVSMRDIAKVVGIKMSSIYYYYNGKDALMENILSRFENGYKHYFNWLSDMNAKAESLEELMDNMFNKEFVEMLNPIACLGMALAVKEQHSNESARKCVFELLYEYSIKSMQADFDKLIAKGIIPLSDTRMIASLFMFSVLSINDMRIHEFTGVKPQIDYTEIYSNLRRFLTSSLMQGTIVPSAIPSPGGMKIPEQF